MLALPVSRNEKVRRTTDVGFWEAMALVFGGGVAGTLGTKFFIWRRGSKKDDQSHELAYRSLQRDLNNELFDRMALDIIELKAEVKELKSSEANCRKELSKVWRELERQKVINQFLKKDKASPGIEPNTDETAALESDEEHE